VPEGVDVPVGRKYRQGPGDGIWEPAYGWCDGAGDDGEEFPDHGRPDRTGLHPRRPLGTLPTAPGPPLVSTQNKIIQVMHDAAKEGIDAAGEDSIAGRRVIEMRDFYTFLMTELSAVIDRWHVTKTRRG
jgi:hypothetical protein